MPKVFISYSRQDADFAEVLRLRLREAGFDSWIDLEGLPAGSEWGQEIDQAIRDSTALILVLTPASRASDYVAYEWAFALGAEVPVIPLLVAATDLPPRLAALQHLDFQDPAARRWQDLFAALQSAENARPVHSIPLPRTAPVVVRKAVEALDDDDPEVVENATARLAELALPEAQSALVEALGHPAPDVRIAAAWQLAKRGDPRAVPGLIEGNRRRRWHHELARKLKEIGPAALPGVRAALSEEKEAWMRRDLVWGMDQIGDPSAVPDLIRLLDDEDTEVWHVSARALQQIGTAEAVSAVRGIMPRLLEELRGSDWVRADQAKTTLRALGTADALSAVVQQENAEHLRQYQKDRLLLGSSKDDNFIRPPPLSDT